MKFNFINLTLILALFVFSCSNPQKEITDLETKVAANPSPENTTLLLEKYNAFIKAKPNDTELNATFLNRAANIQYQQNKYNEAADLLQRAIKDFYSASTTPNSISLLASIYMEKLKPASPQNNYYEKFAEAFSSKEDLKSYCNTAIDTIGKKMYSETTFKIDKARASNFINFCELYAGNFKDDPASPSYLFKAAETARSLRNHNKALTFYDIIYNQFKNYDRAPQALFLKAFTLDSELGKHQEAKPLYEEFLLNFPDNDFADDTQFLLANLGKTDDEIIKGFVK